MKSLYFLFLLVIVLNNCLVENVVSPREELDSTDVISETPTKCTNYTCDSLVVYAIMQIDYKGFDVTVENFIEIENNRIVSLNFNPGSLRKKYADPKSRPPDMGYNFQSTGFGTIKYISEEITRLTHLKELDMRGNEITEVPAYLDKLILLERLYLGNNPSGHATMTLYFNNLPSLQEMVITSNGLQEVGYPITNLKNLISLDVSLNRYIKIDGSFTKLSNLKYLNLNQIGLTSLGSNFLLPPKLDTLILSHNHITNLPAVIGQLNSLKYLDLSGNSLSELPNEVGQLKNLEVLDVSGNNIKVIPNEISSLEKLKQLDFGFNDIYLIPNLGTLQNLEMLSLHYNKIEIINTDFTGMKLLKKLYIQKNNISEIPPGIMTLPALTSLSLSSNNLKHIPSAAGLKSLKYLNLSDNQIENLPNDIFELTELTSLFLQQNDINGLPDGIEKLKSLKKFNLAVNRINKLPPGIMQLKDFTELDVRFNYLCNNSEKMNNWLDSSVVWYSSTGALQPLIYPYKALMKREDVWPLKMTAWKDHQCEDNYLRETVPVNEMP